MNKTFTTRRQAMASAALGACALSLGLMGSPAALAQNAKVLTIGMPFSPLSMDPSLSGNGRAGVHLSPAYEPLIRTQAELDEIVAAAADHEAKVLETIERSDSLPMIEANHRFHMTVARAGKNPYYTAFYKRMLDEGRRMIHIHFEYKMLEPDGVRNVAADHTEMVEAIRHRDADRAEQAAHVHAAQFRGRFMEFLERSIAAHMHLEFTMPQPRALAIDAS